MMLVGMLEFSQSAVIIPATVVVCTVVMGTVVFIGVVVALIVELRAEALNETVVVLDG